MFQLELERGLGSPLRMRGKDGGGAYPLIPAGITPAYAGKMPLPSFDDTRE